MNFYLNHNANGICGCQYAFEEGERLILIDFTVINLIHVIVATCITFTIHKSLVLLNKDNEFGCQSVVKGSISLQNLL